jgi:Copper amine oxidase N-terminal domain
MPYTVNGNPLELAAAEMKDGTTFVPIADLANALGGYVDWDHEAKTARIEIGETIAFVKNDEDTMAVGAQTVELHAKPYLVEGVLWAPVRLFRDGFGMKLNVDGDHITVDRF